MSEPRDSWSKWDIVGKIATPVTIFIIGGLFTCQQAKMDAAEKTEARIDAYVKSLYSESKPERSYAVAMLMRETRHDPDARVLEADIVPGLLFAAADADPLVAAQASKILEEIADASDSAMSATIKRTLQSLESTTQLAVVFASRQTISEAKEAERQLGSNRSLTIRTYLRQGAFRSVAVVTSQADTAQILTSIQNVFGDAYIVRLTGWCRNPMETATHYECLQPSN